MTQKSELLQEAKCDRRNLLKMAGVGVASTAMAGLPLKAFAATGAYVPDESISQTRVWMAWPSSTAIWGFSLLKKVQTDIALLARTIAKYEPVFMIADGATNANNAKGKIGSTVNPVTMISSIPCDDMWMRDSGPVFRRNGAGGIDCIGLNFNGWGNKQTHAKDSLVASRVAAYLGLQITTASVVGEGGGVVQDGEGTLMANRSSWVNTNRNSGKTEVQIEAELLKQYGATKMIWLNGIKGQDITDDHIDATVAFAGPGKLLITNPPASAMDVYSIESRNTYNVLKTATDAKGRTFQITLLDEPDATNFKNLLPSYINYLVVNGAVINVALGAITGDSAKDASAKAKLAALYPGRTVEMLALPGIYNGGGGIHCVTQQMPVA